MQKLKLSELISALSYALDITEGQPEGHCIRCCWIGMSLAKVLELPPLEAWELYYVLLLKDLGCSSNASRICDLYLTDDLRFKREFKWVDGSLPQVLRFLLRNTGSRAGFVDRFRALGGILANGDAIAQELIQTRCARGADIARRLRFGESVAEGIHALDEHWDGGGRPQRLSGQAIPLFARIALLAQVVDVVFQAGGREQVIGELRARSGSWFDPQLVKAFECVAAEPEFWRQLSGTTLDQTVLGLEPGCHETELDEDFLDDIAEAFGLVVDAKSPYTAGHSARVGLYSCLLAEDLGLAEERRRWLRRAALLHDVGKLGVSNSILDKPGKLTDAEFEAVKLHSVFTGQILARVRAFDELARVAAAHHERLDGRGYPLGLSAGDISLETRIITTADIFDAITAERPYRAAVPVERTLMIMADAVGTALDPECFASLKKLTRTHPQLFAELEQNPPAPVLPGASRVNVVPLPAVPAAGRQH